MSDANFTQTNPHGTGRYIAPLFKEYVLDERGAYGTVGIRVPKTVQELRDYVFACIVFVVCERAGGVLRSNEIRRDIAQMIDDRNALGEKKYGEGLRADNGRDVLLDLLQELLDAGMYATQAEEER
jgi:hypothetical protein